MLFSELLRLCSPELTKNKKFKLMRHQFKDERTILKTDKFKKFSDEDIKEHNLIRNILSQEAKLSAIRADSKLAEITCAEQSKDRLKDTQIVFAFAASSGTNAEFIGAFKIIEEANQTEFLKKYQDYLSPLPKELEKGWEFKSYVTKLGYSIKPKNESYYYNLELLDDPINEYKNRVIIDWGKNAIAWVQKSLDKNVVEIRAKRFVRDFTDYYDFVLSFDELKAIINQPDGNPEWINKLSAVSGVYLIVDIKMGNQYIGAAYGKDGFLGRWRNYADNNHGNNKSLKDLVKNGNDKYESNFQISILRVMDKSSTKNEVIAAESFLKQKLGTRVHGLNNN
jgi:hypothetical protein